MTFQQIERVEQGERFSPDTLNTQAELFALEYAAEQMDLLADLLAEIEGEF
jgi:hypothetical protein